MTVRESGGIQSVQRALTILELLSGSSIPMSVIEIGKKLDINRNTVHSLINTLMMEKYVVKDEVSGKYRVSEKLYALSCSYPSNLPVVRDSDTVMRDLSNRYHLELHFGILSSSNEILIVNKYLPSSEQNTRSGFILPCHASGLGKIILAFSPEEKRRELLEQCPFNKYTKNTITSKDKLLEELEEVRKNNYARDNGEYLDNTYCIAFPIFDSNSCLLATFSLSGSKEQLEKELKKIIPDALQCSKSRV